jgi:hypothetical protein
MSRTIKAIERHMILPVRSADGRTRRGELGPRSDGINASAQTTTAAPLRRKSERNLRVVFAPWPLGALTTATK